jgi:hypothetical protein
VKRGRFRTAIALALTLAAVVACLAAAESATAGAFQLKSCMAAKVEGYDSAAFAGARSSKRMVLKRACNPFGRGERGLVTSNKVVHRRLHRNEHATAVLWAPPGTRIVRFDWSGKLRRSDCGWTVELYAVRPGQRAAVIRRATAGRRCPRAGRAEASYAPPRAYRLGSATALVQRVICRSKRGCSAAGLTMLATRYAKAYVVDSTHPGVRILGGGLASGRWVSGEQGVRYTAGDNVGIQGARLFLGGRVVSGVTRPCNYARRAPCPSGPGQLGVETRNIRPLEGRIPLSVHVRDASGNASTAGAIAMIDNTPPSRVDITAEGGQGWRRTSGFGVRWSNPAERYAPIVAAFARLCTAAGTSCRESRHAGSAISRIAGVSVPGPGDWTLSVWRQDAAGNAAPGYASVPVHLRYDPEPPQLAFEHQAVTDPTRVSVLVNDRVSGLAGGEIELRRQGSSVWQTLDVRRQGGRLLARIDDARLPAGTYELRARAADQAGNQGSTASRLDGSPMVLRLPLRFQATMTAGVVQTRIVRKRVRRHGRRRMVKRRVIRLVPAAHVRLGRRARISGRLTNTDGQPIAGGTVYVFSRSATTAESFAGVLTTNGRGRFSYAAKGTRNRGLRFVYLGTPLALPAQRAVALLVRARSSLRASRRRARNGQAVTFRGRVSSLPVPAGGKLVEMQAHFRGRWRTFSTVRTDRRGRWHFRYRFGGTVGRIRYGFRAMLPAEAGYPFESGASPTVGVTVRGP